MLEDDFLLHDTIACGLVFQKHQKGTRWYLGEFLCFKDII